MALDKAKPICGIYKITNTINDECYIGQSIDIQRRWHQHKNQNIWRKQKHNALYLAFAKYGIENFTFRVIENCEVSNLDEREIYWIEKFDSCNKGYNTAKGGQGNSQRKLNSTISLDGKADIISEYNTTFEKVKSFLCPYVDSEDEIDDEDMIEEIDGYDTLFRELCEGYDNYEQWAECNLI